MNIIRTTFPGAMFHIIQRGVADEPIFIETPDQSYFLNLLKEAYEDFKFDCLAYSLMLTHVHLLIRDVPGKLSEFLKILFQRYAQFFNLKYKRTGHLFGRRFQAKLCLDDSYLLILSRYIHLNPVKAKIVKHPQRYPWSCIRRSVL